jgi:hypothetical protein
MDTGIAFELVADWVGVLMGIIHFSEAGTGITKKLQQFGLQIKQIQVPLLRRIVSVCNLV